MRRRVKCLLMVTLLLSSVAGLQVRADSRLETRHPAGLLRPYVPAVSMETDRRSAPDEWARRSGIAKSHIAAQYGATGIVRCGGAIGTAQLTLRADIITTAAHVLIDTNGQPRKCTFQSAAGGAPVAIDTQSIKSGTRTPMSEPATRDWAVARLAHPVSGVTPYGLAQPGIQPAGVFMVAAGNKRADRMGAEKCRARGMLSASWEGVREFAIDCNAAPGSSGAALTAGHSIVGIYVGYRSSDPARAQAFSATHYNFAITVEGPFRRALLAATH
jgi:hypothetical protein